MQMLQFIVVHLDPPKEEKEAYRDFIQNLKDSLHEFLHVKALHSKGSTSDLFALLLAGKQQVKVSL